MSSDRELVQWCCEQLSQLLASDTSEELAMWVDLFTLRFNGSLSLTYVSRFI